MFYYLWNDDESRKTGSENEVDPKDPSEESEVRGDGGSKKRFDLFDPSLPRDEERNDILRLPRYHLYRLRVNIFSFKLKSPLITSFHRLNLLKEFCERSFVYVSSAQPFFNISY